MKTKIKTEEEKRNNLAVPLKYEPSASEGSKWKNRTRPSLALASTTAFNPKGPHVLSCFEHMSKRTLIVLKDYVISFEPCTPLYSRQ